MLNRRWIVASIIGGTGLGYLGAKFQIPYASFVLMLPYALTLIYTDARYRRLPESVTIPAIATLLAAAYFSGHIGAALSSIAAVTGFIGLMYVLANILFGDRAMGFGDVVAALIAGGTLVDFNLRSPVIVAFLVIGSGLGIAYLVELMIRRTSHIPLGAYMLGSVVVGGTAIALAAK